MPILYLSHWLQICWKKMPCYDMWCSNKFHCHSDDSNMLKGSNFNTINGWTVVHFFLLPFKKGFYVIKVSFYGKFFSPLKVPQIGMQTANTLSSKKMLRRLIAPRQEQRKWVLQESHKPPVRVRKWKTKVLQEPQILNLGLQSLIFITPFLGVTYPEMSNFMGNTSITPVIYFVTPKFIGGSRGNV